MTRDLAARLNTICDDAVRAGATPGGVVLVGREDETLASFAFGARALVPAREEATIDTIYDFASLAKPVATATLAMQALEEGRIDLLEPIGDRLPALAKSPIAEITPRELLLHTSGLPAGCLFPAGDLTMDRLVATIRETGLAHPRGTTFVYSDLGFHLLAALLMQVYERSLDKLATDRILVPLGMNETAYGVPADKLDRCAPTEVVGKGPLRGIVHDPVARQLGGVAGHAGLFGTAADLARYCRMILGRGAFGGARILAPATADRMIAPYDVPGGLRRALGWDYDTQYSNPRGEILPPGGVGHTGFTGPSMWIDPPSGLYILILTNRVHPDGQGNVVRLRRRVANVVAAALLP